MRPFISPHLIDLTWKRVATLSPSEALGVQKRAGKMQPEIVGFVIGFTSDLRPDAIGLALYIMLVVIEMFRTAPIRKLIKVRESTITRHWSANRQLINEARSSGKSLRSAIDLADASLEPDAFRYIVEALTEVNPDDPVNLLDDEGWHVLAVLKTAVESLHDGCRV